MQERRYDAELVSRNFRRLLAERKIRYSQFWRQNQDLSYHLVYRLWHGYSQSFTESSLQKVAQKLGVSLEELTEGKEVAHV